MVRKDDQKRREERRIACGRSLGMEGFLKRSEAMKKRADRGRKFFLRRYRGKRRGGLEGEKTERSCVEVNGMW
jgi:hypothetical protein